MSLQSARKPVQEQSRATRVFSLALFASCVSGSALAAGLGVKVHDAEAVPGGTVAVVLRTYASRPIDQGQLCMRATSVVAGQPAVLSSFQGGQVFSVLGDATSDVVVDLLQDPQTIVLGFGSQSATINAEDGPLAVLYFQLSQTAVPGQFYSLSIDLANSSLIDENGLPIPISPRDGVLHVRAPGDPISVSAHAEKTVPGTDALISFQTMEPIPLSGGRVGIHYDPAIAAGPPTVLMDPRHGPAIFTADTSTPGLAVVDFESTDNQLNLVPGDLVMLRLPTLPSLLPGTESPVFLDPTLTFVTDALGAALPLALGADTVRFTEPRAGVVSDLTVGRSPGGALLLTWNPDCGFGAAYGVYRGDLLLGYDSLAFEPGLCSVEGTSATIPEGPGAAEFFLVVPNVNGDEGSYGLASATWPRAPATIACFPQGSIDECGP